ncbi:MAG TPA: helix-turn-helix transcriptional regulator [Thermoanaerobaculia bacterium]|jgi:transcriptional regulator with XRE-family HTH domain|nr:helix-turn-helix transcriptional regulator [Thermoanaerobaculia bacterium]
MKPELSEAKIFGAAMKRWRERRGLTQDGLARLAGIASSYASHIERGENVPSLTIILKVCLALEILPGDLLSDFTMSRMKKLRLDE